MSFYIVDVESDGQILGRNSMVCFGAVRLDNELQTTFYGKTSPVSPEYNEEALAVSGFSRKGHELFDDPKVVFEDFAQWLAETNLKGRPILISDNNGYDASWINWYFLTYCGANPFGYSSRRIGDLGIHPILRRLSAKPGDRWNRIIDTTLIQLPAKSGC